MIEPPPVATERFSDAEAAVSRIEEMITPRTGAILMPNLIGNALEHGSDRSVVTVHVHGDEKEVTVAVHNRGPVIPADQLNGIFNPMKRSEGAGSASGNLGLGLYIVNEIARAHRGRAEVESTEEAGTTFRAIFPRRS